MARSCQRNFLAIVIGCVSVTPQTGSPIDRIWRRRKGTPQMIRKMFMLTAGMLLGFAALASPASAGGDGYTPMNVVADVNDDNTVTLTGDNCPPGGQVDYVVRRGATQSFRQPAVPTGNTPVVDSGSGTADDSGSFEITTNPLPNGRFNITVTCGGQESVLSASINAGQGGGSGGENAGGGNLATTGSDGSIPLARLGVILVATGGVALYAGKKRQGRRAAFVNA